MNKESSIEEQLTAQSLLIGETLMRIHIVEKLLISKGILTQDELEEMFGQLSQKLKVMQEALQAKTSIKETDDKA